MNKKQKQSQQRGNRRELLKLLTATHSSLHSLLTELSQPPSWQQGTPLKEIQLWEQMVEEMKAAVCLGYTKGLYGEPNMVTTAGPKVWRKLAAQAHLVGYQIGRSSAEAIPAPHRRMVPNPENIQPPK